MDADFAHVAAEEIDARLALPGAMDADRFADFLELQRTIGLTHAGRPLCLHLRPYLLSGRSYAAIEHAAEAVAAALGVVAEHAASDPELGRLLGLSDDEQALARIDPGYPQPLAVGRLDMLVTDTGFDFIELNADSPAGIVDQLLVERALFTMPHVLAARERFATRGPLPNVALLSALREIYTAWGGREERPSIAIVDWESVATAAESQVVAGLFREAGHRTWFVDPHALEYDGTCLRTHGERIDLVYRRVIVQELLDRCGMEHALVRAYRDRAVCVANSFRTKLLNKKAAFAVLSDPAFSSLFTPEQQAAIARHVPWTRSLRATTTTVWRGREFQLGALLCEEREQFVLKPNDEYGGKGVLLGWQTPAAEWRQALESGAQQGLIAQERRSPRMIRLPTYRDGVVYDDLHFDVCPFVFAGRMGGAMTRVSTSAVTNVSAGGEVSAVLVVDGPIDEAE